VLSPHVPAPPPPLENDDAGLGAVPPLARLTVKVEKPDGSPAAGSTVTFSPESNAGVARHDADHAGLVRCWLQPGKWSIRSFGRGFTAARLELSLSAGQVSALTLVLEPERRISGAVVDAAGNPIEHAKVSIRSGQETSANLGARFSSDVTTEEVFVTAAADGFGRKTIKVEVPNANVRLELTPGAELEISVVDEANAKVLNAFVDVTLGDFHEPADDHRYQGALSTARQLVLRTVPSGVATIRAARLSQRGLERASQEIALKPGGRAHAVLQLKPASGLEGTVVDPHGVPVAQARVVALWVDEDPKRSVTELERSVMSAQTEQRDAVGFTGPDGRFDLVPGMVLSPDAKYRIQVLGAGLREPRHPILLELGGPPVRVELVAKRREE
jgi:hypothetical protein